MPTQEVGSLKG